MKASIKSMLVFALAVLTTLGTGAVNAAGKPNILVIVGDDIGITNISAYGHGVMG